MGRGPAPLLPHAMFKAPTPGKPFWQDESYDHLIRNDEEFRRTQRYIENNPVRACLLCKPEDYVWSSAGRPGRPPQV